MIVRLKHMSIQNFMGVDSLEIDFSGKTLISGRNASGKTTVLHAFSWCMFDVNAFGSSTFQIRRKDKYGRDIDNVEICVEVVLDIDGKELALKKTQRQKWVKKRGSDAPTYEGNENLFEINGFPSNKREYTAKIASLIDESIFSLLSNPRTFAALPWKQQREIILRLVDELTDEDVLAAGGGDYYLIEQDVMEAGADKAREKYQKALKRLKDDQKAYPIRIDEASKSIVEVAPIEELNASKAAIEDGLKQVRQERNDISSSMQSVKDVQKQIFDLRYKLATMQSKANEENNEKKMQYKTARQNAQTKIREAEMQYQAAKTSIDSAKAANEANNKRIKDLAEKYKATKKTTLPEGATICPTCKRPLDDAEVGRITAEFEKNKAEELDRINNEGRKLRESVTNTVKLIEEIEERADKLQEVYAANMEKAHELYEQYSAMPDSVDISGTDEYKAVEAQIAALDEKLSQMDNEEERQSVLDERERAAHERMREVTAQLLAHEQNKKTEERVKQLQDEQRECAQMVADEEQKLYLVELFIKAKMDLLSDRINSKFSKVRFRLFTEQINGGMTPTCVMQINSNGSYVDYANANNAAQIIGGLDVIQALSELYDVKVPVWLDNSEAIDGHNTPDIDTQMILMRVTDDDLTITGKE